MTPRLKICGITRLDDARYCAGAGADYLGFVQHRTSPRYVEPERAAEIIQWVYGPEPVGVFVDEAPEVIDRIARKAGFALAQLHGDEPPEVVREVELPVIKALHVTEDSSASALLRRAEPYAGLVDYFLLDTSVDGRSGGTGRAFDWAVATAFAAEHSTFLAGGLKPENIATAVARVSPFAVDISSGVEEAPGVKDIDRLSELFDAMEPLA